MASTQRRQQGEFLAMPVVVYEVWQVTSRRLRNGIGLKKLARACTQALGCRRAQ